MKLLVRCDGCGMFFETPDLDYLYGGEIFYYKEVGMNLCSKCAKERGLRVKEPLK